jgi:hypothetical protein
VRQPKRNHTHCGDTTYSSTMAVQWADTLANSTATHKVESPVIDPIERGSAPMIWFEPKDLGTQAHRMRAHERSRSEPHAQAVTCQPRSMQAVALVRLRRRGPTRSQTRPPRTKFLAESWTRARREASPKACCLAVACSRGVRKGTHEKRLGSRATNGRWSKAQQKMKHRDGNTQCAVAMHRNAQTFSQQCLRGRGPATHSP